MAYDHEGHCFSFGDIRLAYFPCRKDGLDANLRSLNPADYVAGTGHAGLVFPCDFDHCEVCRAKDYLP